MDELWLENIQQPVEVERLLGTFASRSGLVPPTACRVRDLKALPEKLRRLLTEAIEHAWLGFSEGSRFWLFTAMVSRALSQQRNAPVLWVNGYNELGALIEVGAWSVEPDSTWCRCGDYAPG